MSRLDELLRRALDKVGRSSQATPTATTTVAEPPADAPDNAIAPSAVPDPPLHDDAALQFDVPAQQLRLRETPAVDIAPEDKPDSAAAAEAQPEPFVARTLPAEPPLAIQDVVAATTSTLPAAEPAIPPEPEPEPASNANGATPVTAVALSQLGLDFGTSTTLVGLRAPGVDESMLRIGRDGEEPFAMSSLVALRPGADGELEIASIGERAASYANVGGYLLLRSVKRHLGCRDGRCLVADAQETWCLGDGNVTAFGQTLPIERVVSAIVAEALDRAGFRAGAIAGQTPELVMAGCPASAGLPERTKLVDAFRAAGLTEFRFAELGEEPVLAARTLRALQDLAPGAYVVYDLGGGSFDVAVIELLAYRSVVVYAADGLPHHGGDDLDRALLRAAERVLEREGRLTDTQRRFLATTEALREAETAKRNLSVENEALLQVGDLNVRISREQFEHELRTSRFFEKTQNCVLSTYRRARLVLFRGKRHDDDTFDQIGAEYQRRHPITGVVSDEISKITLKRLVEEITGVIAVGGATRTPYIQHRLQEWVRAKLVEPGALVLSAVCQGATQSASGQDRQLDRLPWSIRLVERDYYEHAAELMPAFTATFQAGRFRSKSVDTAALEPPLALQLVNPDGKPEFQGPFDQKMRAARITLDVAGRMWLERRTGVNPQNGEERWECVASMAKTPWQTDGHREMIARDTELLAAIAALDAPSYWDDYSGSWKSR